MDIPTKTLGDALRAGEHIVIATQNRMGLLSYRCSSCPHWKDAETLVDAREVEHLPGSFVCDVCWTGILRRHQAEEEAQATSEPDA